jgi:hypothetical protein
MSQVSTAELVARFNGKRKSIETQQKRLPKRQQVLHIQDVLLGGIDDVNESLASKAQAARAFDVLEDRLRELSGKAKLAPIKAEPKRRSQRQPQILPGTGPYVPPA